MPLAPKVIKDIERAPKEIVDELADYGTATVHEAYQRTGLMHGIRPVVMGNAVSGTAVTCLNYCGDNLMLHAAIDVAQPGDIIVCAVTAPSEHGMFGELLATSAAAFGVRAVVLDAAARDASALREMNFPTWARHISANGTVKNQAGWVNTTVSVGGIVVNPGDAVVADEDGVVVIERAHVEAVAEAARARAEREKNARVRLAGKARSLDNGGRRKLLEDAGAYS